MQTKRCRTLILIVLLLPFLSGCNGEKSLRGVISEATAQSIVISTDNKTLSFSIADATKIAMNGIQIKDTATIFYKGMIWGTNTNKCSVTKVIVIPVSRESLQEDDTQEREQDAT